MGSVKPTLLAAAEPACDLLVEWDPAPPFIPPAAAAHLEARWAHYLAAAQAAGQTLFNGPISRLIDVRHFPAGPAPRPGIRLRLGPGEYKSFLVTRLRDRPWFEAHAPQAMTLALGNSALPTRGNYALLGIRSQRVSAYPGRLHLIGGVLEALNTPQFPATRAGIEAHLLLELHEEIGLAPGEECRAGWPRILGAAYDDFLGQPELLWQWELRVPLETLRQRLDPGEHSSALILGKTDMTAGLWEQLTPIARLAWQMWTNRH